MKIKLCDVNPAAEEKLPQHTGDKSGIGVHYVDAYIKPMNVKLEDGTPVKVQAPRIEDRSLRRRQKRRRPDAPPRREP